MWHRNVVLNEICSSIAMPRISLLQLTCEPRRSSIVNESVRIRVPVDLCKVCCLYVVVVGVALCVETLEPNAEQGIQHTLSHLRVEMANPACRVTLLASSVSYWQHC